MSKKSSKYWKIGVRIIGYLFVLFLIFIFFIVSLLSSLDAGWTHTKDAIAGQILYVGSIFLFIYIFVIAKRDIHKRIK